MASVFANIRTAYTAARESLRSQPDTTVRASGYTPRGANLSVKSPEVACRISAVYSAARLISETVAKLPLEVKRYNRASRYWVNDYQNPAFSVINIRPNARLTSFELIRSAVWQVLLQGNAYILVRRRDQMGNASELTLCSPGSVNHDLIADTYSVNDLYNGISGVYAAGDMVHIKNPSFDGGLSGKSVLEQAAIVLGIASEADRESASLFSSGSRYRGIITSKGSMLGGVGGAAQEKQIKATRDRIVEELGMGDTITYLSGDLEYKPVSMTPADVQLLESRKFTVNEIARFFRVPVSLIYGEGGGSYSNAETDQLSLSVNTIEPLLRQIEQEMLVKLMPERSWSYMRVAFDRDALRLIDSKTESEYMRATIETGVYSINDWRRRKGQPAVQGGDEPVITANAVTLAGRINDGEKAETLAGTLGKDGLTSITDIITADSLTEGQKKGLLKVLFGMTDDQVGEIFEDAHTEE